MLCTVTWLWLSSGRQEENPIASQLWLAICFMPSLHHKLQKSWCLYTSANAKPHLWFSRNNLPIFYENRSKLELVPLQANALFHSEILLALVLKGCQANWLFTPMFANTLHSIFSMQLACRDQVCGFIPHTKWIVECWFYIFKFSGFCFFNITELMRQEGWMEGRWKGHF